MHISRRQFVAASVASMLLPRLKLEPNYDLRAMASRWCGRPGESRRYDLTAPYAFEDFAYATDARAMVRFNDDLLHTDGEARIPKCTTEVWREFWKPENVWVPLPKSFLVETGDDGHCWKCGKARVECPQCFGIGEYVCLPGDRTERCEACNSTGIYHDPACDVCHGRYDRELPTVAVIENKLFGLEYIHELRQLPGVRINAGRSDSLEPMMFTSEAGLAGIIMPRRAA